jgi:hypothetical protein
MGKLENVGGVFGFAAELARQRPLRPGAVAMDAADDAAAGRDAGDLLDLGLAVHRKQRHAERSSGRDLALLLDRVAVGQALGRGAGGEHRLGLAHRGDIEAGAELGQELEDFRRRVGLHGIEHLGVRQRPGEGRIVLADHFEVDDQTGSLVLAVLEKFADACGHSSRFPYCARLAR